MLPVDRPQDLYSRVAEVGADDDDVEEEEDVFSRLASGSRLYTGYTYKWRESC